MRVCTTNTRALPMPMFKCKYQDVSDRMKKGDKFQCLEILVWSQHSIRIPALSLSFLLWDTDMATLLTDHNDDESDSEGGLRRRKR